jgi:hypothetical protein
MKGDMWVAGDAALGHRCRMDEMACRPFFGSGQEVMGRCVGGDSP